MPAPGSRIDRFEIRGLLGVGGMGEVHRAHDSRLGREVALKLLPEHFLRDPQRRLRFEREVQVLAALNHPNIGALFEVVTAGDSPVLVLELVEGETLAERIARGPLPVPEALAIAVQITAALEAAHDKGIVHRDLKPGNVKLRPDGTVKLLDFGLAKVLDPDATASSPTDLTQTAVGTPGAPAGPLLGSPAFMSPEQFRGLPADRRADVWAFGCLFFEMLTATRAFPGEQTTEVIARILEREPDFSLLPPGLPADIHRLLRRCLEKDRRARLRDIGDARLELLDVLGGSAAGSDASVLVTHESRRRRRMLWKQLAAVVAAAGVAAAGVLTWLHFRPSAPAPGPVRRFVIADRVQSGAGVAISADGSRVAYVTGQGIVVRKLDELQGQVVVTTNNVQGNPFFSPDGQWLGFKGWDALRKASVSGGEVSTLVDRVFPMGAWSGEDIFYGDTRGLFRVPAAGGKPEQLLATRVEQVVSVEVLPGRHAVLYTLTPKRGNVPGMSASLPSARIEALDLRTGKIVEVLRGGGRPRVTSTGHLLYVSAGTLYAIGFDSAQLQTRGKAVPLLVTEGLLDYDISTDGTLFYQSVPLVPEKEMVWVDRKGREQPLSAPPRRYLYPRISPDGSRIAVEVSEGGAGRDTWIWDLRRQTLELFTKDPAQHPMVAWSPDGSRLAFGSEISGVSNVYTQAADGSGLPELMVASDTLQMPISFAPDGRLLVSVGVPGQQRDIYFMQMQGRHEVSPLIHSPANELTAEVSPDGRWLVYESDESGQFEIYVRPLPNPYAGSRWQLSSGGGTQPVWSRDGREIFYRDGHDAVLAVPVTQGAAFTAGRSHKIFDGGSYLGNGGRGGGRMYDVSADGSRFLMIKSGGSVRAPELVVVLNWFDELRRLAPLP